MYLCHNKQSYNDIIILLVFMCIFFLTFWFLVWKCLYFAYSVAFLGVKDLAYFSFTMFIVEELFVDSSA
jgi:hypothetical protein